MLLEKQGKRTKKEYLSVFKRKEKKRKKKKNENNTAIQIWRDVIKVSDYF